MFGDTDESVSVEAPLQRSGGQINPCVAGWGGFDVSFGWKVDTVGQRRDDRRSSWLAKVRLNFAEFPQVSIVIAYRTGGSKFSSLMNNR